MRTMPISPEKIRVHYNGLNFSKFDYTLFDKAESKAVWGINPDELVIGFLGRFSMMKGHQEFFEAGKILLENYPEKKIKFLVAGGDSFGEKEFGEITREFGKNLLGDQVIYTGSIENTPKVLSAMDILAFPSHEESFGNVLCEAAAMEIAVVASRSGGVPDIVKDQETGILVEPKNSESLAKGISVYIESEDLRNIHGKNARLYVMRKFADDKQLEELENIYKELTLDV
jgi:glycosyltransferase involved in cell wall biosynthesis